MEQSKEDIEISNEERRLVSDFYGEDVGNLIDWNRLMPVVKKISDIRIKQYTCVRFEIVPLGYVKVSDFGDTPITTNVSIEKSLIKAVYKAAIQFIIFYNTQNK